MEWRRESLPNGYGQVTLLAGDAALHPTSLRRSKNSWCIQPSQGVTCIVYLFVFVVFAMLTGVGVSALWLRRSPALAMTMVQGQALADRLAAGSLPCGHALVVFRDLPHGGGLADSTCTITVSSSNLHPLMVAQGTIAHEVAHLRAGLEQGHNNVFRAMERQLDAELGITPEMVHLTPTP